MESRLPFSALLSQAYVAFAIEFDNEFEHQVPHRTTNYGSTPGFPSAPWLISMAFWLRFLQYIPLEGITAGDLQSRLALSNRGLLTWFTRLSKWWRYLTIEGQSPRSSSSRIPTDAMVRPTAGGRRAIEVGQTLVPIMEARWRARFGKKTMAALEEAMRKLTAQLDPAAPWYFSVLEHENKSSQAARMKLPARTLPLPELFAKSLLAFASEFDTKSTASLDVCANVLRVTPDSGIRVRDLPRLTGLASLGVEDALRRLKYQRLGAVRTDPSGSRFKIIMITPPARLARDGYVFLTERIENEWEKRFGQDTLHLLRTSLEEIVQSRDGSPSPLLRGLKPYPDGWRTHLPPPETLPHFPMVSHRGGFPDGS